MLLLASYDIVFQEVPGEVTLALNLSACPNRCPGCHSPHLQEAVGEPLDEALLAGLLERYGVAVSCIGFMGGDADPAEVNRLAGFVRRWGGTMSPAGRTDTGGAAAAVSLKTAWYSGRSELPAAIDLANFDFIKLGGYVEELGGLSSPGTNQRFYRVERSARDKVGKLVDATAIFIKKSLSS